MRVSKMLPIEMPSFCVIFNATVSLYPDSLNLGLTAYETRVRDTIRDFWDQKIIHFEFPSVEVYISYITLIELNYVNSDIADNVMTELRLELDKTQKCLLLKDSKIKDKDCE